MSDAPLSLDEMVAMGMSGQQQAPYGQGYAPPRPGPAHHAPKKSAASDRVRALAAHVSAQRQAMIDSLQNKVVRANAIGVPDKSLIPMSALAQAGFSSQATAQGIPYGIDPKSLTPDERAYLGLPTLTALAGE
jgi:hypothetical protein